MLTGTKADLHLQMASFAKERADGLIEANLEATWRTFPNTVPGSKMSATSPAAFASWAVIGVPSRIICIACSGEPFPRVSRRSYNDRTSMSVHRGVAKSYSP